MIFKQLLGGMNVGHLLDVGCGSGQFTAVLIDSLASYNSITGIDVDADALDQARTAFPELSFVQGNSLNLPFKAVKFDMVVISKALHHVADPVMTLQEMLRVLKPGGWLLVNEMHRDVLSGEQESHMIYHHLRSEIDNALEISHQHTFLRNDLLKFVDELGLNELQIHEFIPDMREAGDEEKYNEFSGKMEGWLQWLDGHPRQDEFTGRIEKVRKHIRQFGIARPPQMVFLGKK